MTLIVKKTIKDKGIALCHEDQGYSANLRPVSLLMKSDLSPEQLTKDVVKALRQVTVEMSFEEFLRKFFYLWSDDAELLAKLLGFETELEAAANDNPDDAWLQEYNASVQAMLEDKASAITIAKSAQAGEELDLIKQYDLLKLQQMFEKGCADKGVTFEETPDVNTQATEGTKPEGSNPEGIEKTNTKKETPVSDVNKSQEVIDLEKQLAEANAKIANAEAIIKAAADVARKEAIAKAGTFSFVDAGSVEAVADFLVKSENAPIVALLEKAQETIADLNAKVEEVKKNFAVTEHGQDGEVEIKDIDKSSEDILKANVQKALKRAQEAKAAN